MTDNQLIALIIGIVRPALAAATPPITAEVAQSYQPTTQGAVSGPSCYLNKIGARRYGFLNRTDVWDGTKMVHTETQWMETVFQFTCFKIQNPADTADMTAGDLANAVASILQSDATLSALQNAGVGILRITDVRSPPFIDDKDRNEYAPSFDFTLTHENTNVTTAPIIQTKELDIYPV